MIRAILLLLLVVAATTLLGLAIAEHSGYVLIAWKSFRYESSLWVFFLLIVLAWLLVWGVRWLWRLLGVSGGLINPWSRRNHGKRQQLAADKGLLDLAGGRWERAVRHLQRAAEGERQPLMHYLGAARAAQQLGDYEQSDGFLERALQRHPQHRQVLRQLQSLLLARADWSALLDLLPELRKGKVLSNEELATLERQVWQGRLLAAGQAGLDQGEAALQPLTAAWQQLSSAQRSEPELLLAYATQLQYLGAQEEAEEVVRKGLKQAYDSRLVQLYGVLRGRDPARQLQAAEALLKQHPQDALLLLCLGRLCLQNSLWGKAREYFEISLEFSRRAETCAELARLLGHLGELEKSNQLFQEGVCLLDQDLPNLPLPTRI